MKEEPKTIRRATLLFIICKNEEGMEQKLFAGEYFAPLDLQLAITTWSQAKDFVRFETSTRRRAT